MLTMNDCVFCKIVKGELPCYKIGENELFLAFLSIGPLKPGHTLIIPKAHVDDFFDMKENLLKEILIFAQKISFTLREVFQPKSGKIGLIVAGLEVPHAHLHLVPMDNLEDLNFSNAEKGNPKELRKTQQKILAAF